MFINRTTYPNIERHKPHDEDDEHARAFQSPPSACGAEAETDDRARPPCRGDADRQLAGYLLRALATFAAAEAVIAEDDTRHQDLCSLHYGIATPLGRLSRTQCAGRSSADPGDWCCAGWRWSPTARRSVSDPGFKLRSRKPSPPAFLVTAVPAPGGSLALVVAGS